MPRVPILSYHHIGPRPAGARFASLYVAPSQLDRQLWALRRMGMRGISMSDGLSRLRNGYGRGHEVVLTFDDGYRNALTAALPILRHHGFKATCFLVSGLIGGHNSWDDGLGVGRTDLMSRADVETWLAAGMEIGSHSCTHPRLQALDEAAATDEIFASRATLQKMFGVIVDHFAYPFGDFTTATVDLVRRCGYVSAVTTQPGTARATDDAHRLPRLLVDGERGLGRFLLQVGTPYVDLRHGRGLFAD